MYWVIACAVGILLLGFALGCSASAWLLAKYWAELKAWESAALSRIDALQEMLEASETNENRLVVKIMRLEGDA